MRDKPVAVVGSVCATLILVATVTLASAQTGSAGRAGGGRFGGGRSPLTGTADANVGSVRERDVPRATGLVPLATASEDTLCTSSSERCRTSRFVAGGRVLPAVYYSASVLHPFLNEEFWVEVIPGSRTGDLPCTGLQTRPVSPDEVAFLRWAPVDAIRLLAPLQPCTSAPSRSFEIVWRSQGATRRTFRSERLILWP
jgi:hypothetical protein